MKPRGCFSNVTCGGMALILLLALTACGGPPKWVKQGSGAFNEKDTKAFYGVGSVTGVEMSHWPGTLLKTAPAPK